MRYPVLKTRRNTFLYTPSAVTCISCAFSLGLTIFYNSSCEIPIPAIKSRDTRAIVPETNSDSYRLAVMSDKGASASSSSSEPGATALGEYCPFIADVPISSYAEPFPIPNPDTRSEPEIEDVKKQLRKLVHQKKFNPPLPLADFCLIAKERWDEDESDSEASIGLCLLI